MTTPYRRRGVRPLTKNKGRGVRPLTKNEGRGVRPLTKKRQRGVFDKIVKITLPSPPWVLSEGQREHRTSLAIGRNYRGPWWFLQGEDRLTCSAQPDHGGMRSDSPRGGITTAGTELMWLIDPKPTNQKETQYSYPHPRASNKISFCWVWSVLDPLWMRLKCSFWLFCYLKSFPHEVQVVVIRKLCLLMNWLDMCI